MGENEKREFTSVEEARSYFSMDRFCMEVSGIEIADVKPGYARCTMNIDERHVNALGYVQGGAIYTLADFTFAVATNTPNFATVTQVSQIQYLNAAKCAMLTAETILIKDGKRSCCLEVRVTDETGKLIALVTTNGAHLG